MRRKLLALLLIPALLFSYLARDIWVEYKYAHIYGKSVMRLLGNGGGGTGFQVEYKGHRFVMTNDHVCGLANSEGKLMADSPFTNLQYIKIEARSATTDLCLLSPVEDLPALTLGQHEFNEGEALLILGHPLLGSLTRSYGKALKTGFIDVLISYIQNKKEEKECHLPKNKIGSALFNMIKMCFIHVRQQQTTALIYPGNSGSPVLDGQGHVRGVAFASSSEDNRASIIPLNDILHFLDAAIDHSKLNETY